MAIKKIKIGSTEHELQTTIANVDGLQAELDSINTELDGSIKSLSIDGKVITYTKNDGTTGTITTQDTNTDTKVTQNAAITTAGEYPVVLAYSTSTSKVTNAVNKTSTLKYNPSTQVLTAPTFSGALSGNASTATKATQDASGNTITSTYETKTDASTKLAEAKSYADSAASTAATAVKNDLLNGAGAAYDTLKELGDLIATNVDAIDALETVAAGKQDKITGAATTVTGSNLTASRVLVSNSSGKIAASSSITTTELGYLDGVTSKIQTQLNDRLKMSGGTALKAGDDLNNCTSFGNYTSSSSSVSADILNTPYTGSGFKLVVIEGYTNNKALQFLFPNINEMYWRLCTSVSTPTWTDWVHLYDMDTAIANIDTALAGKASSTHTHTVSHTPAGTVSKPTFSGTAGTTTSISGTTKVGSETHTHSVTAKGSVSSSFSGTKATISSTYTPAGTVSQPTFTGTAVTSGASSGTTSVYSITGVGSAPSLTAAVSNRCLTFTFSAGSVPTRKSVTLPSTSHTHSVTAAGTVSQPTFSGTQATISATYTPAGTVTSTFTGSAATSGAPSATSTVASSGHTHGYTPAGTVSQPTFSGTAATLTTSTPK